MAHNCDALQHTAAHCNPHTCNTHCNTHVCVPQRFAESAVDEYGASRIDEYGARWQLYEKYADYKKYEQYEKYEKYEKYEECLQLMNTARLELMNTIATPCNTLQLTHGATRCNTLQHTNDLQCLELMNMARDGDVVAVPKGRHYPRITTLSDGISVFQNYLFVGDASQVCAVMSLCGYMYVCIHTYMCICICYIYIFTCVSVYVYMREYIYTYICKN